MKYTVVYTPEAGRWNVEVPSVPGCVTWGRSLAAARRNAREAIAAIAASEGRDADRIEREAELQEEFRLPWHVRSAYERHRYERERLAEQEQRAARATQDAVRDLLREGLSVRDVGDLLGFSHQRIQQIKDASKRGARPIRVIDPFAKSKAVPKSSVRPRARRAAADA